MPKSTGMQKRVNPPLWGFVVGVIFVAISASLAEAGLANRIVPQPLVAGLGGFVLGTAAGSIRNWVAAHRRP